MNDIHWVKEIKAIGFDVDGTLYPASVVPDGLFWEAMVGAVQEKRGIKRPEAEELFTREVERLSSHTRAMKALGIDGEQLFVNFWDKFPLEDHLKPDPELVKMFDQLKEFRLFILSNSNRVDQVERKLKLIGIDPGVFETIETSLTVGAIKPEPEAFNKCLEKLSLVANEVLYVGDRPGTDMVGAHSVGMRTAFVGENAEKARQAGADWVGKVYEVGNLVSSGKY